MSARTFLEICEGSMSISDLLRAGREPVDATRDAVVEARPDADHHVAIVHREVRFVGAVHPEHAQELLRRGGIGAEPHQRRGDREARQIDKLAQQLRRVRPGIDNAAAGIEDRPLGVGDQIDGVADRLRAALHLRPVGFVDHLARPDILAFVELDILRDVDHHRTRTPVLRDIERLVQDAREIVDVLHEVIVLRAGARDADRVAFLERVRADQRRADLPGDADNRDRIHQRVGEARHRVRRAGAGCDEHNADLAAGARIAFGRVHGALLVPHEEMLDHRLLEDFVVDRKNGAAGIPEDMLHALIGKGLHEDLSA